MPSYGKGWRPDIPDQRDQTFHPLAAGLMATPRPIAHSLRKMCPGVYDQGKIGSCTGNTVAAAIEIDLRKQRLKEFVPSRLMLYYDGRALENATTADAGASIRDVIKGAVKLGVCSESPQPDTLSVWPYIEARVLTRPTINCYAAAKKTLIKNYARIVQSMDAIGDTIAAGFPVTLGATLYESFESDEVARTGMVPMPAMSEKSVGGHATLIIGYDDERQLYEVRNSWGKEWGDHGYCWWPYSYVLDRNLCDDFWVVNTVGA